jgi:hypothetical protein
MKNESGAYIFFNDSDEIDLFLFLKCEREVLKDALPINFSCGEIKDDHNCLCAFFQGGYDYLGSGKLEDIPNIIKEKNMYNILDNSYENCISNGFYKLTKKQFNNFKDFSKSQLENN